MHCSRRRFLVAGGLTTVGVGLGATTAQAETIAHEGAPGVGDEVYPGLGNGGYRVLGYSLDLDCTQGMSEIPMTVKIVAIARKSLTRFNLDSAGLTITSVDVDHRKAEFEQDGEELIITPHRKLPRHHQFTVSVEYVAEPGKIAPPAGGWVTTDDGFATAPQPAGAHTIFPCNDHPSDKARFVIKITAPKGLTGVASGHQLHERTHDDESVTTTWTTREPMATELVQISVGEYTTIKRDPVYGTELRDVVPVKRAEALEPALALTADQLAWIGEYLGPFPLESYGILPANTDAEDAFDFTGLETQTLTLYKPGFLEQSEDQIGSHMMHELVHNWWGNSVSPSMWSDLWINEGHADFYGLIYRYEKGWPDSNGYTTMVDRMKYTYSQGNIWRSTSGPVAKPTEANLFDNQRYTGAVLVLYALRELIGNRDFMRTERVVLAKYKNRNVSTEDYIDVATRVAGDKDVRTFLEDWLYGTTIPAMPNHPDWEPDPVPTSKTRQRANLQTDKYGV